MNSGLIWSEPNIFLVSLKACFNSKSNLKSGLLWLSRFSSAYFFASELLKSNQFARMLGI